MMLWSITIILWILYSAWIDGSTTTDYQKQWVGRLLHLDLVLFDFIFSISGPIDGRSSIVDGRQ